MKKSLITLALLGAMSATASAQSNVTIYGVVDVGVTRENGGPDGPVTRVTSGISSGSRLGFRGTEDLGGGMSAIFQLESGLLIDTGSLGQGGLLYGRQAYVGLTGNFGEVTLGRVYSQMDKHLARVDPFASNSPAQAVNLFVKGELVRVDNGIKYVTPDLGGVKATFIYGAGEVAGNSSAKRYLGGGVAYDRGPIYFGVAYQNLNTLSTTLATGSVNKTLLGGAYDFGVLKLHGGYAMSKTDDAGKTTEDTRDAMIAAAIPFGASTVLVSYVRRDDKMAANNDASQIGAGYYYALSKRTVLYVIGAHIKNTNKAAYTANPSAAGGVGNDSLAVGVRHSF